MKVNFNETMSVLPFIQLQYLKQQNNSLWCFCGLKYGNSFLAVCLVPVCNKGIAYTTEKAQIIYFVQNYLVKIPLLYLRNAAWLYCYCYRFCLSTFWSLFAFGQKYQAQLWSFQNVQVANFTDNLFIFFIKMQQNLGGDDFPKFNRTWISLCWKRWNLTKKW